VHNDFLYTFGSTGHVFDVSDPMSPIEITTFDYSTSYSTTFDYPYACISAGAGPGLVNISVPESTHIAGFAPMSAGYHAWIDSENRMVYASGWYDFNIYSFYDTRISEPSQKPEEITLRTFPNPFNESCKIEAPLSSVLSIYDIKGKLIKHFVSNNATWNGKDNEGRDVPSGLYLIKAIRKQGGQSMMKRVVYMK